MTLVVANVEEMRREKEKQTDTGHTQQRFAKSAGTSKRFHTKEEKRKIVLIFLIYNFKIILVLFFIFFFTFFFS
jgi:hypothetical protein